MCRQHLLALGIWYMLLKKMRLASEHGLGDGENPPKKGAVMMPKDLKLMDQISRETASPNDIAAPVLGGKWATNGALRLDYARSRSRIEHSPAVLIQLITVSWEC